jgi:glutamate dehydrogenase/leucine dehydrogenase
VGSALAEHLAAAGAALSIADIDTERAREVAARVGATAIEANTLFGVECDVYAPCAVGGVLTSDTVERLRCRIVAGSANNQLAEPEAAESSGELDEAPVRIGVTLREIYDRANQEGISTAVASDALADQRLHVGI